MVWIWAKSISYVFCLLKTPRFTYIRWLTSICTKIGDFIFLLYNLSQNKRVECFTESFNYSSVQCLLRARRWLSRSLIRLVLWPTKNRITRFINFTCKIKKLQSRWKFCSSRSVCPGAMSGSRPGKTLFQDSNPRKGIGPKSHDILGTVTKICGKGFKDKKILLIILLKQILNYELLTTFSCKNSPLLSKKILQNVFLRDKIKCRMCQGELWLVDFSRMCPAGRNRQGQLRTTHEAPITKITIQRTHRLHLIA